MRAVVFVLALSMTAPLAAQVGSNEVVPVPLPERPFVLLDAPRRFLPSEDAEVRLQVRDGGHVHLSLFEVRDPASILGRMGRNGLSVAAVPIGASAEALVAMDTRLPRRGADLTLVRHERIAMPSAERVRNIGDETQVYDSHEELEENVATYWVSVGNWSVRRVSLGRLRAGLYLVQVRAAAWVASALLSVGDLVLVARRGDRQDLVRVTDGDGAPIAGVRVRGNGEATTSADGIALLPASDDETVRFSAQRGRDFAWADVAHVRLAPCDPRVYVATGRPVVRPGERLFVRGHVRGCAEDRYAPLANRTVRLESGESNVSATTDADGNFAVELVAAAEIVATLDGRAHRREVQLDARALPTRDLIVEADRPWAAAGQVVEVRVADEDGGWPSPADVVLDTPNGRLTAAIGPGRPAIFHVRVTSTEVADRMVLNAALSRAGMVTLASTEIFVGRAPVQLELEAPERGASGEEIALRVEASDLGGARVDGPLSIEVFASDGNRARGAARRQVNGALNAPIRVALEGEGPWMIRARGRGAIAERVVWSRQGPPALADRAELAIAPATVRARPGQAIAVHVRRPTHGHAWLTLEQGGVLEHRLVDRSTIELPVPARARGLATLVLTHVHRGRVRTASAALEVETSLPIALEIETDRSTYGPAQRAHVVIEAKGDGGAPRDAVFTLWLADAGYWGLGDDAYPMPDDYFRLPGRPASSADSTAPVAFGAEEGRRLESQLLFDGRRLTHVTHRHAWRYGGEVVRISARGPLQAIANAIASAARLRGADVSCEEDTAVHELRARDLPWDMIAERVGEAVGASVAIEGGRLSVSCDFGGLGASGMGAGGGGHGVGTVGLGSAGAISRAERLEGVLHFVGLTRLGPDGRAELEVPMPDHPGRWRIEVLAIADDGGGARAHRNVLTRTPLEAWLEVPRDLAPGDSIEGSIQVQAQARGRAAISLRAPDNVALANVPSSIELDAQGRGSARFRITARTAAPVTLLLDASLGTWRDSVRAELEVHPGSTERPIYFGSVLGAGETRIDVPLPELARPMELAILLDPTIVAEARRLFDALREPRWDVAALRADRLASLAALRRAVHGTWLEANVSAAIGAEAEALSAMQTSTGELGWGDRPDPALTLEVLEHLPYAEDAHAQLRERLARGALHGESEARAARLLLDDARAAAPHLRRALDESGDDPSALTQVLAAADHHGLAALERAAADRLVRAVETRISTPPARIDCRGSAWFLCTARRGDRGVLARAALGLIRAGHPRASSIASRVGEWIAAQPPEHTDFVWGTSEADVLELLSSRAPGRDTVRAYLDDREVPVRDGRVEVPAGSHRLELRVGPRAGRLRRIAIQGVAEVHAPSSAQGNAALSRRFEDRGDRWELVVAFTLPRAVPALSLTVPLPAGLTPDVRGVEGASIAEGSLRLRMAGRRGANELRIPMLELGRGSFTAGPALLTGDGVLGLTPSQRVEL